MFHKFYDKQGNLTIRLNNVDNNGNENKFFLHSKYDVIKEAQRFGKSNFKKLKKHNIVYGFGLGYHIRELLKHMNKSQNLYIFDLRTDIYKFAINNLDLKDIMQDKRVNIFIENCEKKLSTKLKPLLALDDNEIFIYKPCVMSIDYNNRKFKLAIEKLNINKKIKMEESQIAYMKENIRENFKLNHSNVSVYFNKFKDIPGVVISAGPSLDYVLPYIEGFKEKAVLFSVGRCLKALVNTGIEPDFFSIIDPDPITYLQIEECEKLKIPLVYLNSAYYGTVKGYEGPKFISYNDNSYVKNKNEIIDTGGSVATAVLDMLIRFGCNPIIFVGQDLGFTKYSHHCEGALFGDSNRTKILKNMRKIKGVAGEEVYTTLGYLSFKDWIENKIKDNPHIEFINASKGGAHIQGTEYMDIQCVLDKYIDRNYSIREIISKGIDINKL